jgi:CBS domain-containing protein
MTIRSLSSDVVATATPQETIRTAAQRMVAHDVGTLVVVRPEEQGKPVGFLTDRDIMARCVAAGVDPDAGQVGSIMSQPVHSIEEHASVEEAVRRMEKLGTRRLVLVNDDGRMVGLLSLDDILSWFSEEIQQIGALIAKQRPTVAV